MVREESTIENKRVCVLSHVQLFVTAWTVAHPAPLSMGFPRQEYWSGLLFPSPEDLPRPKDQTRVSCVSCTGVDSLPLAPLGKCGK